MKGKKAPKSKPRSTLRKPDQAVDDIFVAEYLSNGFNGAAAYRVAHPKASAATAGANAYNLLKKTEIRKKVREWVTESLSVRKDTLDHEIIQLLLKRAFYDPEDFIDENGLMKDGVNRAARKGVIDGMIHRETKDSSWTEYKLADRDKALELLAKYIALIKPDPGEGGTGTKIIVLPSTAKPEEWEKLFGGEEEAKS